MGGKETGVGGKHKKKTMNLEVSQVNNLPNIKMIYSLKFGTYTAYLSHFCIKNCSASDQLKQ